MLWLDPKSSPFAQSRKDGGGLVGGAKHLGVIVCTDQCHRSRLAERLLLHAGALGEEFTDLAAGSRPDRSRLLELATSIALLTEAAVELESAGDA